ncbi:MAG: hypothetical protein ACLPRE_13440 [Limisphaerales bacterium]
MRLKTGIFMVLASFMCFRFTPEIHAQSNVVVAFTTTNSTPLNIGFAGFTTELLGTGIEYGDTNMQKYAAMLSPGWLLFPAGTTGDAFNWQTGLTDTRWQHADQSIPRNFCDRQRSDRGQFQSGDQQHHHPDDDRDQPGHHS